MIKLLPNPGRFGHSDGSLLFLDCEEIRSEGKKTAVVSTINGDANTLSTKSWGNQGISAEEIPVVAFS